jgi:RNA polymerase sigma factor (TIGR02999 family)
LAPSGSVTGLLQAWRAGDEAALERLTPLVYQELRRIARRSLRSEREGHSLQATALVHEAYLRLVDARHVDWHDRVHFFAMAARLMRRVLVDHARARRRGKRGKGAVPLPLTDAKGASLGKGEDLVALDDALRALATLDRRKSHVVELRFFGGLSVAETAAALSVSADTVMRDWKLARAWLRRELGASEARDA